ncbi:MAG TPA: hypothetical protein HPP77_05815, partial [Candidatus Hydrogenedentes bacterium]|nr:hypothetical protein [Candidatus Hydrogenedentota bacterium]
PFDTLPGAMQGAPALIAGIEADPLRTTNTAAPEDEGDRTAFEATLAADGALELRMTFSGQGNAGTWLRGMKDYDAQRLRSYLEQLAAYVHPSAVLGEYETTDLADLTQAPEVTLECRIPEYAVTAGDELMLFTLPGLFYTARDVGRPSRQHNLHWEYLACNTASGTIRLPDGFRVYALPQDVDFRSPTVRYAASLREKDSALLFEDRFERNTLEAPADAYADFKASQEIRANIPRQRIILMRE